MKVNAGVLLALLVGSLTAEASAQLKDPTIGSRALTDADMTRYVAIVAEVTSARREITEPSSVTGLQALRAATAKACEKQGWGTLDYGVVNARVTAALQHLKMEATVPVPANKKADVELVRQWKTRIDEAKSPG